MHVKRGQILYQHHNPIVNGIFAYFSISIFIGLSPKFANYSHFISSLKKRTLTTLFRPAQSLQHTMFAVILIHSLITDLPYVEYLERPFDSFLLSQSLLSPSKPVTVKSMISSIDIVSLTEYRKLSRDTKRI